MCGLRTSAGLGGVELALVGDGGGVWRWLGGLERSGTVKGRTLASGSVVGTGSTGGLLGAVAGAGVVWFHVSVQMVAKWQV